MSIKIDSMGATTFTSNLVGVLRTNPDPTNFAVSCSQVQNFINNFLFYLHLNRATSIIGTWSNVLTNQIRSPVASSTNIRGSVINLGSATTTVKVLSNTLNIDSNYTTILSGISNMSRFQAGYVTLPTGTTLFTPPNFIGGGATSFHMGGTTSGITGYGGISSSRFNLGTTNEQEVNWIYFI
jgi:hypothetical protein